MSNTNSTIDPNPRDPEIEAEDAIVAKYSHMAQAMLDDAVRFGYHAALRSLGAGTPEAVAALRELVTATLRRVSASKAYHDNGEHGPKLRRAVNEAAEALFAAQNAFAAQARYTDTGRDG